MRTVLPSDVVNVIEGQFPWTRGNWRAQAAKKNEMRWYAVNTVPGILKMIEGVPEDLLTFGSVEYGLFTMAIAALEVAVARGKDHEDRFNWPMIVIPKQSEQEDCLVFVKNALSTCPDQAPSKSTKGLTFISDAASRETLLIDLGFRRERLERRRLESMHGSIWVDRRSAPFVDPSTTFRSRNKCGLGDRRPVKECASQCSAGRFDRERVEISRLCSRCR